MNDSSSDKTSTFTETEVEVVSAGNSLKGSLVLPARNLSSGSIDDTQIAVLLLSGSGKIDRNENAMQMQLNIFNDIAHYLAEHAIASVRYDKRGNGLSKGNFDTAGHTDLVADANAWLDFLANNPTTKNASLYIMGHSEGSLIASQLCSGNNFVKGQILLMPFVEEFESVIRRQAQNALDEIAILEGFKGTLIRFFLRFSGDQIAKQRKLINKIRKGRRDTFKIRKQAINAKWIREMLHLDAKAIHAAVTQPSLIIGGEKDLQCLPGDVEKIAALIKGPTETRVFGNLTHILRADEGKPSVQNYVKLASQEVDRRVLTTAVSWLERQNAKPAL